MHLLQVLNVGNILGGTAACAWTVTRALPDVQHTAVFLGPVSEQTRLAFTPARVLQVDHVDRSLIRRLRVDLALLHNTAPAAVRDLGRCPTLLYAHSTQRHAPAQVRTFCSKWLRQRCAGDRWQQLPAAQGRSQCMQAAQVLYQSVPLPPVCVEPPDGSPDASSRGGQRHQPGTLVVGRICTPLKRKWPAVLPAFYSRLAAALPQVQWEFVGCPEEMRPALTAACAERAVFRDAGWDARSWLWRWDALLYHHPTLTESFGRTVAEALRCGCIPIVDDRGGFREQIVPGTGWLCRSPEEFRIALQQTCDLAGRLQMSQAAAEHGNREFGLTRFRRDLLRWLGTITSSEVRPDGDPR